MAIHRHMGYGCSAALLPLSLMTGIACAADPYPVKPIRWIVPTSAGSGADTVGRIVTNGLAQVTGQTVVVENRAGAAGNIAAEFVATAFTVRRPAAGPVTRAQPNVTGRGEDRRAA